VRGCIVGEHGRSGGNIECEGDEAIATTKERSDADCNDLICNDITHDHEYTTTPKISTAYLSITSFSIAHLDCLMIPEFFTGAYEVYVGFGSVCGGGREEMQY
jgi:hypothetical protein